MRILHRHAHQGSPRTRRNGAAALWPLRLARDAFFTPRERAALAWTEALTLVSQDQVPDSVFELARKEFSESELVDLSMAVVSINGWNRLSIGFRAVPGSYVPAPAEQVASHA